MTPTAQSSQPGYAQGMSSQPMPVQLSLSSSALMQGQKAIEIEHNGSTYKLQATRLGKLILTK